MGRNESNLQRGKLLQRKLGDDGSIHCLHHGGGDDECIHMSTLKKMYALNTCSSLIIPQ